MEPEAKEEVSLPEKTSESEGPEKNEDKVESKIEDEEKEPVLEVQQPLPETTAENKDSSKSIESRLSGWVRAWGPYEYSQRKF